MNVLFDTDVLVDFLLDREPFAEAAAQLLTAVDRGELYGCACANSITTVFYLTRKAVGAPKAKRHVRALLSLLQIAGVNESVLAEALDSRIRDFEDAVVAASAARAKVDIIVTRNLKDFKHATLPVQTPAQLLTLLTSQNGS